MSNAFKRLHDRAQARPGYWEGLLKMRFANDLGDLLQESGKTQADLARKIRKSPQYVCKVLRGEQNLTIGSMVKLLWEFDRVPRIEAVPVAEFFESPAAISYTPTGSLDMLESFFSGFQARSEVKDFVIAPYLSALDVQYTAVSSIMPTLPALRLVTGQADEAGEKKVAA